LEGRTNSVSGLLFFLVIHLSSYFLIFRYHPRVPSSICCWSSCFPLSSVINPVAVFYPACGCHQSYGCCRSVVSRFILLPAIIIVNRPCLAGAVSLRLWYSSDRDCLQTQTSPPVEIVLGTTGRSWRRVAVASSLASPPTNTTAVFVRSSLIRSRGCLLWLLPLVLWLLCHRSCGYLRSCGCRRSCSSCRRFSRLPSLLTYYLSILLFLSIYLILLS